MTWMLALVVLALLYVLYDLATNGPVTKVIDKIWNKIPILNKIGGGGSSAPKAPAAKGYMTKPWRAAKGGESK